MMKMDTRHQEYRLIEGNNHSKREFAQFHFTPITSYTPTTPAPFHTSARLPISDKDRQSNSRDVIPVYFERNLPAPTTLDADRRRQHASDLIDQDIDVRFASARDMASASMELYLRGMVSYDEYARLAFQPELHPNYDATIGALLGQTANPDKPRDFVRFWEERLAYERRYKVADAKHIRSTERITLVMRRLAGIPSIRA